MPAWFTGEFLGTFLLVFFGCGSVASAVLTGAQVGIFQIAIVWGVAIAGAIHLTGSLSGAHLNPAITLAFAVWAGFPWKAVPRYLFAQFAGAFVASALLYIAFQGVLENFEQASGIVRGTPGSEASAMIFGEFYPNPGGKPLAENARKAVPAAVAFFVEALGTGVLALVIFGNADARNKTRAGILGPAMIGLTVCVLISIFGALTMAAFNPARDLAPRFFSSLVGWGEIPFTANGHGWLTVYVIAPIMGALVGGGVYRFALAPHYASE